MGACACRSCEGRGDSLEGVHFADRPGVAWGGIERCLGRHYDFTAGDRLAGPGGGGGAGARAGEDSNNSEPGHHLDGAAEGGVDQPGSGIRGAVEEPGLSTKVENSPYTLSLAQEAINNSSPRIWGPVRKSNFC